jgi:methyltransferase (TIGR00027 family)
MTAYLRARHVADTDTPVFNDYLARDMMSPESYAMIERRAAQSLAERAPEVAAACPDRATAAGIVMQRTASPRTILARARYAEESLEAAMTHGVRQYLILGAGLDTFAFRRTDLLDRLQVFEVDHPNTQAFKRERIAALGWETPAALHFVPTDFTTQTLADTLAQSSYDPHVLTHVSWLGVTMYLREDDIRATVHALSTLTPAGSALVFDYLDAAIFTQAQDDPRVQHMLSRAHHVGETMHTGFSVEQAAALLAETGYDLVENLDADAVDRRYFRDCPVAYAPSRYAHIALAQVRQ